MLAHESICCANMNAIIEETMKSYPTCLDFPATIPKDKIMSHKIPVRPLEAVRTAIFTINSTHYLCTVDYNSKFPAIKQVEGFSTDNLTKHVGLFFRVWAAQQNSFRYREV